MSSSRLRYSSFELDASVSPSRRTPPVGTVHFLPERQARVKPSPVSAIRWCVLALGVLLLGHLLWSCLLLAVDSFSMQQKLHQADHFIAKQQREQLLLSSQLDRLTQLRGLEQLAREERGYGSETDHLFRDF
jgi:hypothetical protein